MIIEINDVNDERPRFFDGDFVQITVAESISSSTYPIPLRYIQAKDVEEVCFSNEFFIQNYFIYKKMDFRA